MTRRELLARTGPGFFGAALATLLGEEGYFARAAGPAAPLDPREPHFPAKAKACIFLFMVGGPSHVDLWDPKPELARRDGQPSPHEPDAGARSNKPGLLMGSPFQFAKAGKSGLEMSELWPHLSGCADDLAVVRATRADTAAHASGLLQMSTGFVRQGFPSMGSWLTYGLGTAGRDLPGFVVLTNGDKFVRDTQWGNGFLPAAHQGTPLEAKGAPVRDLAPADGTSAADRRAQLDLLAKLNDGHRAAAAPGDPELAARTASYELAFRMQAKAPEAVDLSKETAETRRRYGLDEPATQSFGRSCLLARRLVERGVRFVQLMHSDWDTHTKNNDGHRRNCLATDRPIAGLLTDLRRRGLLDSTVVFWAGEMGRSPHGEGKDGGRDHHARGFSTWLAGGGVKGSQVVGATDELGYAAVEDPAHVHDLHATVLHLMGLDHERLTYPHAGRDHRLTDVGGRVLKKLLA